MRKLCCCNLLTAGFLVGWIDMILTIFIFFGNSLAKEGYFETYFATEQPNVDNATYAETSNIFIFLFIFIRLITY